MKTTEIIAAIDESFAKTYKNAAPFVGSGALWDFCMETIRNPITMSNIAFANDLYLGTGRISLKEISFRRNICDKEFYYICNALLIRRFGTAVIKKGE